MKASQKNNKSSKKALILVLIAILFAATVGGSYAYWDSLQSDGTIELTVGDGTTLSIEVSSANTDGKTLVPYGVIMGANDINAAVFTYDVALDKEAATPAMLTVSVVEGSVKIGGSSAYADLIKITIAADATISSEAAFTVTVEFDREPDTQEAYEAVKNAVITFDIHVEAAVA